MVGSITQVVAMSSVTRMVSVGSLVRRKETTILLFAIPSLIVVVEYLTGLGTPTASGLVDVASNILPFTFLLGGASLIRLHVARIQARKSRVWQQSVICLAGFATMFFFGVLAIASPATVEMYNFLVNNVLTPLNIAMVAGIGFYIFTILFRACGKLRNLETGIFIVATIMALIYNNPAAAQMWPGLITIAIWIRDVPNNAGARAVLIGVGLGLVQMFVRTLLGLERSYVGESST